MVIVVGFVIIGSYPKILDNSKGENSPFEGVKQRHKVKLRKGEKPEEGKFSQVATFPMKNEEELEK
jgi:hypothetical protein